MIDFHSHILPGMDDGSVSVSQSIEMLRLSYSQGITTMAATSHFYATKEAPGHFLKRRARAWEQLSEALSAERGEETCSQVNKEENRDLGDSQIKGRKAGSGNYFETDSVLGKGAAMRTVPEIILGAEVCYYVGIARTQNLRQLCIGHSNVLLLEMPFHRWSGRMVDEIIELAQNGEVTVLLAHIDRYLSTQPADTWDTLAEEGIRFQVNASCFLDGWLSRRRAFRLLQEGKITSLGSDCHNMDTRKPNLGEAFARIEQKEGKEALIELDRKAWQLLRST